MNSISRNAKIAIAAGVVVLIVAIFFLTRSRQDVDTYTEFKIEKGKIDVSILSTGTVQPQNRLDIKPPVDGRAEKVLVQEGTFVKRGQLLGWMSSSERAAMLDAAQAQGPEEVKHWEELYRPTAIMAPIDGMIIQRNVEAGQTIAKSDAILVMSDRLTVQGQVDETDIAQVKVGQTAQMTLDAYQDHKIAAKVDRIAFDAKTVNNVTTYIVDVLPNVTPAFMRSGMTANVVFHVTSKDGVVLVPTKALKIVNGSNSVLLKGEDGKPVQREVELGVSDGRMSEVISGLKEGDIVMVQNMRAANKNNGTSPFSPMGPRGPKKK